jgi:hypothetical protein
VAGGDGVVTELYDPATEMWEPTANPATPRFLHTATLLPNGKVLIAAGADGHTLENIASAELYDPTSGTWATTVSLHKARNAHTGTLLPDAKC